MEASVLAAAEPALAAFAVAAASVLGLPVFIAMYTMSISVDFALLPALL
jgi:hypothetical protein